MNTEIINAIGTWMLMAPIYAVGIVFFVLAIGYSIWLLVQAWKEAKTQVIIILVVIAWFVIAGFLVMYQ